MTSRDERRREVWKAGRDRFIRRETRTWLAYMIPTIAAIVLLLPPLLGEQGYLTIRRVVWVLVVVPVVLGLLSRPLAVFRWRAMERRYGGDDGES
jgi:hypothetical protein